MPTRHDFTSDHPLPVFLSNDTERYEEPRRSSFLLKTAGLFVVAAIVIGAAVTLTLGNPLDLFAEASQTDGAASQADSTAAQPTADQSPSPPVQAPSVQSTADAGQTAGAMPSREDVTAATDNAAAPPSGALLKQFQSWAAQQDTQPQVDPEQGAQSAPTQIEPVRPIVNAQPQAEPAQAAPTTQVMQDDTPAPARVAQKHRRARPVQNARAEIRIPRPRPVAGARPDRTARADGRPPQDGRPPDQPQQAQSPSFLQSIGLRPQQ